MVATVVFLERLFHFHRAQIKSADFLKGIFNILQRKNIVEAVSICEETPGPVAFIVKTAILHHEDDDREMGRAIQEAGLAEIPRLEKNMGLLATMAHVTPLLGLLGTVLGMMKILLVMQQNTPLVQAGDLAMGMWEALVSTAAGLAVAIPAYIAYNFLVGRIESIVLDMERASSEIMAFLSGQQDHA